MTNFLVNEVEILKAISDGKDTYKQTRDWVHQRACEALYYAAQFGSARSITSLFEMVSKNDGASFKAWVMTHASFINEEGKSRSWLKYSQDKGFQVMSGKEDYPETVRKDTFEPEDLLATVPFYDTARATRVALAKDEQYTKAISTSIDDLKTIVGRMEKHNIKATLEVNNAIAIVQEYFKALSEGKEIVDDIIEEAPVKKAA